MDISLHTHWIYSTCIFLFSFRSLYGYTGETDNSTIDSQLARTISYSFFFFASESRHHTDDIGYTLSTHTDTRAMRLPYI